MTLELISPYESAWNIKCKQIPLHLLLCSNASTSKKYLSDFERLREKWCSNYYRYDELSMFSSRQEHSFVVDTKDENLSPFSSARVQTLFRFSTTDDDDVLWHLFDTETFGKNRTIKSLLIKNTFRSLRLSLKCFFSIIFHLSRFAD